MTTLLTALRSLDDSRHRAELYRMWHAGFAAAFTHPHTMEVMGPRQSTPSEEMRRWVLARTRAGWGIGDVARRGGERLEEIERALLILGDETGRLEECLRQLADHFARKHTLMLWVKRQLTYPVVTGLAACFIAPIPVLYFVGVRAYLVAALASATLLMFAGGGVIVAVARRYGRKPPLARARMARALATAVEAGLPLGRSIRLAADASDNDEIRAFVSRWSEREISGGAVAELLIGCPHMTPDFLSVIATAERTGDFTVLTRLAELYEDGFR